jgi:hypothetical protein
MRRQVSEFGLAERRAIVQRVNDRDQRLLGLRPAGLAACAAHGGADLIFVQVCGLRECRDMDAPFVFATGSRAGAVDDDLTLAQR